MKKEYSKPHLLVHGSVEMLTLGSQGHHDPKALEGNDGCGMGMGQCYDGRTKHCS